MFRIAAGAMTLAILGALQVSAGTEVVRFEVASIKPSKSQNGASSGGVLPGNERYKVAGISLGGLIMTAYGVSPRQVSGPASLLADRYDVDAKAEHPVSSDQMMQMLQRLLAERLNLKVRREMKELPIYALVAARGGAKLHQSDASLGGVASDAGSARGHIAVRNASMSSFVSYLSAIVGDRIAVDKTGLKGTYDFDLRFSPEQPRPGTIAEQRDDTAATGEGPSIFTALQEQLGLKLEPRNGPVESLIVENVGRPSAN